MILTFRGGGLYIPMARRKLHPVMRLFHRAKSVLLASFGLAGRLCGAVWTPRRTWLLVVLGLAGCLCSVRANLTLADAYAELGFDPHAPGNSVVVFFSDPHMNLNAAASPAPVATTNLDYRLISEVNAMHPAPAKIIVAGDVASNMAVIPGADATKDPPTFKWATNEMYLFSQAVLAFTNISQSNIVWIPGNHDQGAYETNAEAFRMMFPHMPTYQTFEISGLRFFLVNAGNYGQPGEAQSEWLRSEAGKIPRTQAVAVVTHQPPFTGIAAHRGTARLLREVFGEWENRWWVLDGHEHSFDSTVYNVGKSNVAQITIGPATTNTFVAYSIDCGYTVLCLSNGLSGIIYRRYLTGTYRVLPQPDWDWPKPYSAAFEDVSGLVWRRLRSPAPAPELIAVDADNSMDWWAYPRLLEWEIPLGRHLNEATHFLLLVGGMHPSATLECSMDRVDWTPMSWTFVTNMVYHYPMPPEVAAADKAFFRFRGTLGNNWVAGWGLATTNGPPTVSFPQFEPQPYIETTAGSLLSFELKVINPYSPPDTHRFTLLSGPEGAAVDRHSGIFQWRPPIGSAPSVAYARVRVEDDGTPVFAAEQDLHIVVTRPAGPQLELQPSPTGFSFRTFADAGRYLISSSEDGENWQLLTVVNPPDIQLDFIDPEGWLPQRAFRVHQDASPPRLEEIPPTDGLPYRLRVTSDAGLMTVETSEDMAQWRTVIRTNIGPVSFEVMDPSNTGNRPVRYRVQSSLTEPGVLE